MLAFRLLGKRELGRLSPFELVTLMIIPEVLSNAVQGEQSLLQSLAGLCTIFGLVLLSSIVSHRFEAAQHVMEASPTLLVLDGRLLEDNLNHERIAPDELFAEMRKQGLDALASVRVAVLRGQRQHHVRAARRRRYGQESRRRRAEASSPRWCQWVVARSSTTAMRSTSP